MHQHTRRSSDENAQPGIPADVRAGTQTGNRAGADNPNCGGGRPAPVVFTVEQAAAMLQVRPSWLVRKAAQRAVPCTFIGRRLRFTRADLDAIVAAGRTEPR